MLRPLLLLVESRVRFPPPHSKSAGLALRPAMGQLCSRPQKANGHMNLESMGSVLAGSFILPPVL
jgi:hypothetical protein